MGDGTTMGSSHEATEPAAVLTEPVLTELALPGRDARVLDRLREVAAVFGDRVALESAGCRLTYADLERRARELAAELLADPFSAPERAAGPDGRRPVVGILAEQSADSVAAMYALIAAGLPCVVFDAFLPVPRLGQIAELAGVEVMLADDAHAATAEALPGVRSVHGLVPTTQAGAVWPKTRHDPDAAALVMFTSGSTGVPKGVVYPERALLASAVGSRATYLFRSDDRMAMVLPQAFAAGLILAFQSVLNGVPLYIRDPRVHGVQDLVEWVRANQITVLPCTPSLLRSIQRVLGDGECLDSVRLISTAGEKVHGADFAGMRPHVGPTATFVNIYGSSETQAISMFEVPPGAEVPAGDVPAGTPLPGQTLTVLGPDGREVSPGGTGILTVTSAYVAGGYWAVGDEEDENQARFTPLADGRTRYRTSDRASVDPDGVLHLRGRVDDAVKIRGYLVEAADVETSLRGLPDVADVVVRARPGADGQLRLVAWAVPEPSRPAPSPAALRQAVGALLPDWMVPRDIVLLTELPRNERGKVDVSALPEPPARGLTTPPVGDTEAAVASIWASVLRLEAVGRDESFTALGGDSLNVEQMLAVVTDTFGVSLVTGDLAEHPTVADFAALVATSAGGRRAHRGSPLVRLRSSGSGAAVFCIAGAGGAAAFFAPLAVFLSSDHPVYALQANGLENRGVPDWSVAATARRYGRIVQQVAPTGPVVLVGHSLGGLVALRMADVLRQAGREVSLLALVDTFLPPRARGAESPPSVHRAPVAPGVDAQRPRLSVLRVSLGNTLVPARMRGRRPSAAAAAGGQPAPSLRQVLFSLLGQALGQWHRPTAWDGPTVMVLSADNRDDPRLWNAYLPAARVTHRVECDHLAVLKPPYVTEVGTLLNGALGVDRESVSRRGS